MSPISELDDILLYMQNPTPTPLDVDAELNKAQAEQDETISDLKNRINKSIAMKYKEYASDIESELRELEVLNSFRAVQGQIDNLTKTSASFLKNKQELQRVVLASKRILVKKQETNKSLREELTSLTRELQQIPALSREGEFILTAGENCSSYLASKLNPQPFGL